MSFTGVIAVDGPSGSGKSTVCRRVAAKLGLRFLDTGAMYRAVTWAALERGIDLADTAAVAELAHGLRIDLSTDPEIARLLVDGVDATTAIRQTVVSEAVSAVSTNLAVRAELVARQRAIIADGRVVAEGRDITTVVAPDADVRILLTADESSRLSRRAKELHGTDDDAAISATRDQILRRDTQDSTVVEFRTAADGVVELDTSTMDLNEVVAAVLELTERATAGSTQ